MDIRVTQYRVSRLLGRAISRTAAALTLFRMPPFVSASAIVVRDGQVLAVTDPIRREPVLPGGHLKWREAPLEAVRREVREETGYAVVPQELVDVVSGDRGAGELGVVRLIYTAEVSAGELRASPEGQPRWLKLDDFLAKSERDADILRSWVEQEPKSSR